MVDFREVVMIENSQSYENLVEENITFKRKNYFLTIVISTIVIVSFFNYLENIESRKRSNK
jgi:hypothetical protein